MSVEKPLKAYRTGENVDKFGQFEDLDTLSSYIFSYDPTGKTYVLGSNISDVFDNIDAEMTTAGNTVNPNRACFSAYTTTNTLWAQNSQGVVEQKIIFDTQVFDTSSSFLTTTSVFTAPVSGLYFFLAQHAISDFQPNKGVEAMKLYKNNVFHQYLYASNHAYGDYHPTLNNYVDMKRVNRGKTLIHLNQNDTIHINVRFQTYSTTSSTYNHTTLSGRRNTFFQGYLAVAD